MASDDIIDLEKLEKLISDDANNGDTFRPEQFYGKKVRVPKNKGHQEDLTTFIQKFYTLNFVEPATSQEDYYLYELHPLSL